MKKFNGFTSSETFTPIPDSFYHQLLNEIEAADELKVTVYALWRMEHIEGAFKALCQTDFDPGGLGLSADEVAQGLEKAVQRGSLLRSQHEADVFYFLNSPRGRAAAEAFAKGQWRESARILSAPIEHPNIFKLYEENIGALTPLIADMLREAEKEYPDVWFKEAFEIAVAKNARHWRFVEAVLKRWKDKGKDGKKDQQDAGDSLGRYTEGEFAEYLKRDDDDSR